MNPTMQQNNPDDWNDDWKAKPRNTVFLSLKKRAYIYIYHSSLIYIYIHTFKHYIYPTKRSVIVN